MSLLEKKDFHYIWTTLFVKSRLERQDVQGIPHAQGSDSEPDPLRAVRDRGRHGQDAVPGGRQGVQEVPDEPGPVRQHAFPVAHVWQWRATAMLLQVSLVDATLFYYLFI